MRRTSSSRYIRQVTSIRIPFFRAPVVRLAGVRSSSSPVAYHIFLRLFRGLSCFPSSSFPGETLLCPPVSAWPCGTLEIWQGRRGSMAEEGIARCCDDTLSYTDHSCHIIF